MRVERSNFPFGTVKFESKSHRHDLFEAWANHIFAQPDMEKFLEDLGIQRSINLLDSWMWRGILSTWHSSCRAGPSLVHLCRRLGRICPSLEDVTMLIGCHCLAMSMRSTYWTNGGENKSRSCRPRYRSPSIRPIKRPTSLGSSTSATVLGKGLAS